MINSKRRIKRYENWKRNVASTSTFAMVCGLVAVLYFFYRIILIASPIAAIEQSLFNPTATTQIVCSEDEGSKLQDPLPLLSAAYQTRIQQQKPLASNVVVNADLTQTNSDTDGPVGYSHSVDDDGVSYQYVTGSNDIAERFLRVINTKERLDGQISPAWQMDPATLSPEAKTYAYSFWYRSTIPVHVSLESTIDNRTQYSDVMTLDASPNSWQQFTGHFDNINMATSFRADINGLGIGQVDSRGFDIHQIPDAELSKGVASVTFDDGWQSVSSGALPLLQKYGIRTTQYIISETAEHKVAGYMTYRTVAKLKAAGHEIGSHTLTHCNQTELPMDSLQDNAVKSKQMLEQQNLGPIKSFAYPLGQYNKKTQSIYQKQYSLIRTSDSGYNDRYYDETNVHSMSVVTDTSDATFRSWLSYAKSHHLWLVLVYHRVDESGEYSVTSAQLDRQLKMIQESGLAILPMSEAATAARK